MTEEATNSEIPSEDENSLDPESAETENQETEVEGTEGEEELEAEKPKAKTAKDRIDELTRLRREAERDAEYWRAKALQAPEPVQERQPTPIQGDGRPDPEKYEAGEFDTRYVEDLTDWKARTAVAEAMKGVSEQTQAERVAAEWRSRVEKAAEAYPDFEDKVLIGAQRNEWACSPEMGEALRASDKGTDLAYHLASNPAEAARISRLSPALQLMELGKLEATLSQPKAKTATTAPTPAPQVRGSGGKFAVPPDTNDFAAFEKQYDGSN